jgi:hypothetical protein
MWRYARSLHVFKAVGAIPSGHGQERTTDGLKGPGIYICRTASNGLLTITDDPLCIRHKHVKLSVVMLVLTNATWPTAITVSVLFAGDTVISDSVTQCDGVGQCLFCRSWWP